MATGSSVPVPAGSAATVILKRDERQHEMQLQQVTAENLSKIFKVDEADVWLHDGCDGRAYFADSKENGGSFNLHSIGIIPYSTLTVEGSDTKFASRPVRTLSSTGSSSLPGPSFRSVIAPKQRPTTFALKVIMAKVKWREKKKPSFNAISQLYIELTENTANVGHVLAAVRKRWGEDFVIVTNDGIEMEDCPGTQGLTFWKSPRRLIYAINKSSNTRLGKRKAPIAADSEDEDAPQLDLSPVKVDKLIEDIDFIKKGVGEIICLNKDTKFPLGLRKLIDEAFTCCICGAKPIIPPVIVTKCCKSILGCEPCVNRWYSGEDALVKMCPKCRAIRGYNETMLLQGLDNFLLGIEKAER